MAKKASKKPKGLAIARNNMKFACSWKKGESYSNKQQFSYVVDRVSKTDKWSTAVDIGKGVTSRSVSLSLADDPHLLVEAFAFALGLNSRHVVESCMNKASLIRVHRLKKA